MLKHYSLLALLLGSNYLFSQVGVNTLTPDSSSILDIESTTKGILLPRISNFSNVLNPAPGLIVYDINRKCISQNIGTSISPEWSCLSPNITRFFYMPTSKFDTAVKGGSYTVNLYDLYRAQFNDIESRYRSPGAPEDIPFFNAATDLYYYVTSYDSTVFEIQSITADGNLTYIVKPTAEVNSSTYLNVVFVIK